MGFSRCCLAAILVALTAATAPASAAPATGDEPFSLQASGLLGEDGTTDLALTVTSPTGASLPPSRFKHIQLKSFNKDGKLGYTRNLPGVEAPGGTAVIQRTDLMRDQPVQVQVQVQTPQTKRTQVLRTVTTVKLRPDLVVGDIEAPA